MTEEDKQRYLKAQHAMQTGVALHINLDPSDTDPKHLRVGINSAMCDHAALAKLLISKGLITEDEYFKSLADEMEAEVQRYRKDLYLPDNVDLGKIYPVGSDPSHLFWK